MGGAACQGDVCGRTLRHMVCDVQKVGGDEEQSGEEEQDNGGHGVEEVAVLIAEVPHQHHHGVQEWRLRVETQWW